MPIIEKRFRGSVICRVLGYPISYGIVRLLLERGQMDLEQISNHFRRTKSSICFLLTKLRLANVVRYDRRGKTAIYWIKYPEQVKKILEACEQMAERTTRRIAKDF